MDPRSRLFKRYDLQGRKTVKKPFKSCCRGEDRCNESQQEEYQKTLEELPYILTPPVTLLRKDDPER